MKGEKVWLPQDGCQSLVGANLHGRQWELTWTLILELDGDASVCAGCLLACVCLLLGSYLSTLADISVFLDPFDELIVTHPQAPGLHTMNMISFICYFRLRTSGNDFHCGGSDGGTSFLRHVSFSYRPDSLNSSSLLPTAPLISNTIMQKCKPYVA